MNMQLLSYVMATLYFLWVLLRHYSTFLPPRKSKKGRCWEEIYHIKEDFHEF